MYPNKKQSTALSSNNLETLFNYIPKIQTETLYALFNRLKIESTPAVEAFINKWEGSPEIEVVIKQIRKWESSQKTYAFLLYSYGAFFLNPDTLKPMNPLLYFEKSIQETLRQALKKEVDEQSNRSRTPFLSLLFFILC